MLRRFYSGEVMAKVLVIDDAPNVRALLDMLLRPQGYDVILAENGWKGLQLYRQDRPDVILLDLNMPELDGVTVLKQIRSVDLKQPVIVLTGDSTPETERQVRALGVSEFIAKGSSLHLLGDTLKRLLKTPTPATPCSCS
jgi:CheY-like chemotaxis protein